MKNFAVGSRSSRPARDLRRALSFAAILMIGALAAGCVAADASAGAAGNANADEAMASLRRLIGDAVCDHDDQCRTVAIGHKACGGPEAYLAWSTRRTDPKAMEAAATVYNRSRNAGTLPGNRVSNCLFVTDPGALCLPSAIGRACQLRPPGSLPMR